MSRDAQVNDPEFEWKFTPEVQKWIDAQKLNRLPGLNRFHAHKYLIEVHKVKATQSVVSRAIDNREIPATFVGNSLLVSEYDLICWLLSRRNSERGQRVSA